MDLAILIDGSGSICQDQPSTPFNPCDNWKSVLNFVNQVLESFEIGPDETRVTVGTFATKVTIPWDFTKYVHLSGSFKTMMIILSIYLN